MLLTCEIFLERLQTCLVDTCTCKRGSRSRKHTAQQDWTEYFTLVYSRYGISKELKRNEAIAIKLSRSEEIFLQKGTRACKFTDISAFHVYIYLTCFYNFSREVELCKRVLTWSMLSILVLFCEVHARLPHSSQK